MHKLGGRRTTVADRAGGYRTDITDDLAGLPVVRRRLGANPLGSAGGYGVPVIDFTTGSSIIPQKRNLDLFELIRGRSAQAGAELQAVLAIPAKLPSGYHRGRLRSFVARNRAGISPVGGRA